jgi:FkbM family methyltransferase
MTPAGDHRDEPYLSVVVAARNGDHGQQRDPIGRLQAFVNCFEEQCRRASLDAELIVVEWNPPAHRPAIGSVLLLPEPSFCTYRIITVPDAIHQRLRFADVMPFFPMIARNVGIRRARGRFVLATNIEVILSMELVDFLASRQLQPGYLYRADRHDIESDFPADAPLEVQMTYCASHQLRIHRSAGTYPVDATGSSIVSAEDIVDSGTLRLGDGWHVLERTQAKLGRWASQRAELIVDPAAAALTDHARLTLEVESNPYDDRSWVEIVALEEQRPLVRARVVGRQQVEVPLWRATENSERKIELQVTGESPDSRRYFPPHERRDSLHYRVSAARLGQAPGGSMFEYPSIGWTNAFETSSVTMNRTGEQLRVTTAPRRLSYAIKYGPLMAPEDSVYRFELTYVLIEGGITVGVLSGRQDVWLPSFVKLHRDHESHRFEIVADLCRQQQFWIVVSNEHPHGEFPSTFVVHRLEGSAATAQAVVPPPTLRDKVMLRLAPLRRRLPGRGWREWMSMLADGVAAVVASRLGPRGRDRIVHAAPEFQSLLRELGASRDNLRELASLRHLADLNTFLREHRPDSLHTNQCGDFQLMAREHWIELQGYPELETAPTHIDGVFAYVADAAGIMEHTLGTAIYRLEDGVDGASTDAEAPPKRAVDQRGIRCLDASTVNIWAAYMRWLERPMRFNSAGWGFAGDVLPEQKVTRSFTPSEEAPRQAHPVFEMFRAFDGWAEPGFERSYYGINVRDWLFTGTSRGLTDRRAVHIQHPPVEEEYFEWIALLTAIANATERFCFAEIGAGWGRWSVSAAAVCRQKGLDFSLIAVEPEPSHFEWMQMALRDNDIDPEQHELFLAAAAADSGELLLAGHDDPLTQYGHKAIDPRELADWRGLDFVFRPVAASSLAQFFARHERIDLVDMDVQGTEHQIVAASIDVLNQKVRMLHVGTHSKEVEAQLASVLWKHGWLNAFSFPSGRDVETCFGRIAFGDGVQTWVNPRWPELHRALVAGVRRWSPRAAEAHAQR